MSVFGSNRKRLRRTRSLTRRLAAVVTLVVRIGVLALVALVAGFGLFLSYIPGQSASPPAADGIVALTGSADRLSQAFDLLAEKRAGRMLITGVYSHTDEADIARLLPKASPLIGCCVDLDRRALNTAGNGVETERWVRENNYRSVIVVTSDWHMPRTLVILRRTLKDISLVPYPVVDDGHDVENWWRDSRVARLLVLEYAKYLATLLDVAGEPRVTADVMPQVAPTTSSAPTSRLSPGLMPAVAGERGSPEP